MQLCGSRRQLCVVNVEVYVELMPAVCGDNRVLSGS